MARPVIGVDFDGTLVVHGALVPGALDWLDQLQVAGYDPTIFTTRAETPSQAFWVKQKLGELGYDGPPLRITNQKMRAHVYLDDRAMPFSGRFPSLDQIRDFEPWWNRD